MALRSIENVLANRPTRVATRRSTPRTSSSLAEQKQPITGQLDLTDSSNCEQLDEIMRLINTAPKQLTQKAVESTSRQKTKAVKQNKTAATKRPRNIDEDKENGNEKEASKPMKRVKSNKISIQLCEFNLFESDNDDLKQELIPKQVKKTKTNKSLSKSKAKPNKDDDLEEIEKQLRVAAQEYNEIKNYKLIVEKARHD